MTCMKDNHLFILSGQSNMARMPLQYFSDAIHGEIGTNHTVIVKHAIGGQLIRMWDTTLNGRIYNGLISKIVNMCNERSFSFNDFKTVWFIWMQGESDALYRQIDNYYKSFHNVLNQLRDDLGRQDIKFIIGRANDWGYKDYKGVEVEWIRLRKLQEALGSTDNSWWVNTDDLNGIYDDAHNTLDGYKILAERYADIILNEICGE